MLLRSCRPIRSVDYGRVVQSYALRPEGRRHAGLEPRSNPRLPPGKCGGNGYASQAKCAGFMVTGWLTAAKAPREENMAVIDRVILAAARALTGLSFAAAAAYADGIDPGLWKITTRTQNAGVMGSPHESSKCLTAQQT